MTTNTDSRTKTWREQRVPIHGNDLSTVYFNDTTPNHVLISNSSSATLYVGVNGNVNSQSYDLAIPPYATKLLMSMLPYNRIYIFNSGIDRTDVSLKSWVDEFNSAAIAQSMEMVGGGQNGLLGIVEVNNILSPLPSGHNVIGGVRIANFDVVLPTGNNNIGRVDVDKLPNHAAKKMKVTGKANEEKTVKIEPGVVYKLQSDLTDFTLYDGTSQAWLPGEINTDVGLKCDTDIRIRFVTPGDVFILFH